MTATNSNMHSSGDNSWFTFLSKWAGSLVEALPLLGTFWLWSSQSDEDRTNDFLNAYFTEIELLQSENMHLGIEDESQLWLARKWGIPLECTNISAFARACARNIYFEACRKYANNRFVPTDDLSDVADLHSVGNANDDSDCEETQEAIELLLSAVTQLSAQQQLVMRAVLKNVENQSFRKLADELGMNEGTMRTHYLRAINNLKVSFGGKVAITAGIVLWYALRQIMPSFSSQTPALAQSDSSIPNESNADKQRDVLESGQNSQTNEV